MVLDHENQEFSAIDNSASNTAVCIKKGRTITFQLALCIGSLMIQLARVHSWNPSLSSVIAKKSTPSATIQIPKDCGASDSPFWASFADQPIIPSSELMSSRYLVNDPKKYTSDNNILKMAASSSGGNSATSPSMLLNDDFYFPVKKKSLTAATAKSTHGAIGGGNIMQLEGSPQNKRDGRVLGFDVFQLHAKRPESSAGEENQISMASGTPVTDSEASFMASGITRSKSPLSNGANDETVVAPSSTAATGVSSPTTSSGQRNTGVRLLRYSSPLIPAWFPWIPTKSQIMTLKLKELKEACSQRGLTKTGNKGVLQERLWDWTVEQPIQHQARLNGDFFASWFEHDDYNDTNSFLLEREQKKQNNNDLDQKLEYIDLIKENSTPDSLAEWSRTIDPEKLTQKRQEIIRQKRVGKKPDALITTTSPLTRSNKNHHIYKKKKNNSESPAATKEYLTKLSNAMKTSPSSPYASNRDVRELYDASKKADQLGEPSLAIDLLESLVKLTPNDARIYRRLSRMHNDQGNLAVARATLQEGLRKLPQNPWLWHGLGQLELSQGRTEYAVRCYQRAIQEDPTFAHSYHAWGIHEFNNGQIAKSMKILKKGIEYCPTNHRLHHALGDLYRGAKLPNDAERSYRRALEEGPPVSHSFALSALASVAYEQGNVDEARRWLYQSIERNNGRHAQGWLALAEIEEADGNVEEALKVCEASIIRYENGLVEARKRYKRGSKRWNNGPLDRNNTNHKHDHKSHIEKKQFHDHKSCMNPTKCTEVERGLLKSIPKYRCGDKFLAVFRHWARLEGRYGTFDGCNRIYKRASMAFPLDHKISLDWARYHANIRSFSARRHFAEACKRASTKDAEPYREYASFEMSLGEYEKARKILFRGAQALSFSSDGGTGKRNQQELARLYITWAVCEWYLHNIPRVEVLFDHALRLTEVNSDEGSELRSFVLFCMAKLEYFEREELHRSQNCIGLCLKETSLPGGNAPIWNLWAKIASGLENPHLESKCLNEAKRCKMRLEGLLEDDEERSSALDTMNMLKGSQNILDLMREKPWYDQLRVVRMSWGHGSDQSLMSPSSKFYSSIRIPTFENHNLRKEVNKDDRAESEAGEASVVGSEGMS